MRLLKIIVISTIIFSLMACDNALTNKVDTDTTKETKTSTNIEQSPIETETSQKPSSS